MKKISLLLLVVSFCCEVFAGRIRRDSPFQDQMLKRLSLSKKTIKELKAKKESLESRHKKIIENSCGKSIEELLASSEALQAFFLRCYLRDVEIVLACKLQEEEQLKRALFRDEASVNQHVKYHKRPFINQAKPIINKTQKHRHR